MELDTEFNDLGTRGNNHSETEDFDDLELLEGCQNVKLIRIRIWYDDFVYGIQTLYETSNKGVVVSPKRIQEGAEVWNLQYEEIFFNRDECITSVTGNAGSVMDHVIFATNQGREVRFGLSDGGEPFDLEIPEGSTLGALKGGYGDHLHNLGGHSVPLSQPLQYQYSFESESRVANQISAGPTHDDTTDYNDVEFLENTEGQHRIVSICVFYDDEYVFGLDVKYIEMGAEIVTKGIGAEWNNDDHKFKKMVFASDEWVANISGCFDNVCELLTITTTKGREENFGNLDKDPDFNFEIPEGQVISGISFGIGGHLHNITAYFGREPCIHKYEQAPVVDTRFSLLQSSTDVEGPTHEDSKPWDDWDKLDPSIINTRLRKVTVYFGDKSVYGLKLKWNVNEEEVEGEKHRGSEYDGYFVDGDKESFSLKYGEYITKVYGRKVKIIKKLCFELNTGVTYEYGKDKGDHFELNIPENCGVGALTGACNGHLHNIQAWYGQISSASQGPADVYYFPSEDRWPHQEQKGGVHDDTTDFQDDNVNFNHNTYRIDTVKIYHNNKVQGIQIVYEQEGRYIFGEKHMAEIDSEEHVECTMLNLEVDEFITYVGGRESKIIECIIMRTNKGREIVAGGEDGDEFDMDIPEGWCVGAISGGKNGDIHYIKILAGMQPKVLTTRY
jgi:hypothetical protein